MTAAHAFTRSRPPEGLYDPAFEHDACGVAFVATLTGVPSHEIVRQGPIAKDPDPGQTRKARPDVRKTAAPDAHARLEALQVRSS